MSFSPKTLSCRDCGVSFEFTVGEQEFYAAKGFKNEPSRCPTCRTAAKKSGTGNKGTREYFTAPCAQCGKEARIPFQPREGRAVYCSDCFSTVSR